MKQIKNNVWQTPVSKNYKLECCNCGLVHKLDFRVHEKIGCIQFRARREVDKMTINKLATLVAEMEGKKKQVNIAQIKEILSCIQKILKLNEIDFYTLVRNA
jgi:hypothetical protein